MSKRPGLGPEGASAEGVDDGRGVAEDDSVGSGGRPACQRAIVACILARASASSPSSARRNAEIHASSCRSQFQGSLQSRRMTSRVWGMDAGCSSGLSRAAEAGEGSASVYRDRRARVSPWSGSVTSW